ncbi:hypothetical protein AVEN_241280-1 [Araneus ventricosus]|uniref:Uncharacterized protein n=1 Tax=Araneus ventricosus TaxID=182803 RepID=A0A4Y2NQX1_ARAVE|nr:hypothetical protein AVEN_241280-1 [Araneus ventricosus]
MLIDFEQVDRLGLPWSAKVFGVVSAVRAKVERLYKLLAEVETDKDSDIDNEDNGPGDAFEENFSDHENFSEQDTDSKEDGRHCFFTYQ